MPFFVWVFVFIFGAIVGSFFNVVLLRKNTGEKIAYGRSRCFSCGRELRWNHNIPLVSFVILRGRCAYCKSKISLQYPIVEFLVGVLAVFVFLKPLPTLFFLPVAFYPLFSTFYFLAFSSLFLVAMYDARTKIIDGKLLFVFSVFACLNAAFRWFDAYNNGVSVLILYDAIAALSIWFFFWALCFFSNGKWIGRGDSNFAFWCSIFLGAKQSVAMVLLSYWIGGVFGIAILLVSFLLKKLSKRSIGVSLKTEIPFAPFLALGVFVSWVFGVNFELLVAIFFLWI